MVVLDTEPHQHHKQLQQLFGKGTEVEVSSDDEGFRGAWYRATIVESPPRSASKKRKKTLVEYRTLVTDDGSTLLTEYVDPAYIRPVPPEEETSDLEFVENDAVDARYRDGWWTGIVRKVLEKSKYRVYFDNPPDVIDFDGKDLRVHWEWVDGNWVRPEKQQTSGSIFSSGTAVEVNIDKENLRDVWIPAKVIKENGDNTFLVKYQSSRNGDEAGILKVTLDSFHIRPTPPHYLARNYELLERVDTFYDIGWRAGVITKVLAGRRYNVFFKHGNEDKELSHSEIRLHFDWIDGKWVSNSKEVLFASDNQKLLGHACDSADKTEVALQLESSGAARDNTGETTPRSTNIRKNRMEQSTPCNENSSSLALPPSKKKIKLATPNGTAMRSRSSKKLMEGNVAEAPLSVTSSQLSKMPIETSAGEAICGLATPKMGGTGTRFSKTPGVRNNPSARTENPLTGKNFKIRQQGVGGLDYQKLSIVKRKGRPKSLVKIPRASAAVEDDNSGAAAAEEINKNEGKKSEAEMPTPIIVNRKGRPTKSLLKIPRASAAGAPAAEIIKNEGKEKEAEIPVVLGLKAKGIKDSLAQNHCQLPNKELLKLMRDPRKILYDSEGDKNVPQKGGSNSQKRKRGRPRKLVGISPKSSDDGKDLNEAGAVADEMVVKDLMNMEGSPALIKIESRVSQDASREKTAVVSETDCMTKVVDMAIACVSNNSVDDDQPLSTWFGGMQALTNVEESRLSSGRTVVGLNEGRERQIDVAMDSSIAAKDSSVLEENQRLPFEKRSPVWKTIECMEVFQILPQKPHFRPLGESKEEYREGSAIGIMVTFASLFEKISMLQFDDPRSVFNSTLESLLDLEKHGFDVTVPRGRVSELLSIKDGQGQLLHESKDVEREIMDHTNEKTKFDREMEEIRKKITELEEQHAAIKFKKETKDLDISRLRLHVDTINQLIQNARHDFAEIATGSWKLA